MKIIGAVRLTIGLGVVLEMERVRWAELMGEGTETSMRRAVIATSVLRSCMMNLNYRLVMRGKSDLICE